MSRSQRLRNFMEIYTTGMLPSSIAIGWIVAEEGVKRNVPKWKSFSVAVMGAMFYPVTMPYLAYKIYKNEF
jgi:hypothetical protein